MLIDDMEVRNTLSRLVRSIWTPYIPQEDLLQEALIHLWQRELQSPGQCTSWYIQSCRFHLLNLLQKGRSLDAGKRSYARCPISDFTQDEDSLAGYNELAESTFSEICAKDMIAMLSEMTKPREQQVLRYLMEGFDVGEIAQRLGVSHQAVSKHRGSIARVARLLESSIQR